METFSTDQVAGMSIAIIIPSIVVGLFALVCMWKIYTKAGKPGWAVIVPIYNVIVMLEIADKPWYWLFLFCIPFVNFIFVILWAIAFLEKFQQPGWHIVLMILFNVFYYAYLAFSSKVEYQT